jgi:hypothetical protein
MRATLEILVVLACLASLAIPLVDLGPMSEDDQQNRFQKLQASAKARHEAIDELYAGRLTLAQAAARFEEITAQESYDVMHWVRTVQPNYSDQELYYVHVLMYAEARVNSAPDLREIAASYRSEFEAKRSRGEFAASNRR